MDFAYILTDFFSQRNKKLLLPLIYFFFGVEHGLLELFQFLIDVTLRVDQRLLSYIGLRNQMRVGFGNLDIITENIVKSNLQRIYSCFLPFGAFQRGNPFFAVTADRS
ncbi:MAG: hypothetical protein BWY90_01523 [Deltaproteobacteria bacterium ADurb.BinA014]|nr:MAG: hypothetical protein BWY90_01523 [Deltaproteobacteria bacterium ADurb.BinA014]